MQINKLYNDENVLVQLVKSRLARTCASTPLAS